MGGIIDKALQLEIAHFFSHEFYSDVVELHIFENHYFLSFACIPHNWQKAKITTLSVIVNYDTVFDSIIT